jgi:hypothetical protein
VDGADVNIAATTVVGAHAGFRGNGQTVGGVGGALFAESSRIRLEGSLLALNLSGRGLDDCFGPVTSGGHNLTATPCAATTRATDILSRRPGLEPIGLYGGPTPVFALRPASPAVDAGGTACPNLDQRGRRRRDGACDIGAFELQRRLRARAAAAGPAR